MKYVTLYPETSNIELVKDVGQIPYNLHRFYNYDTEIVANNIDKNGNKTGIIKTKKEISALITNTLISKTSDLNQLETNFQLRFDN